MPGVTAQRGTQSKVRPRPVWTLSASAQEQHLAQLQSQGSAPGPGWQTLLQLVASPPEGCGSSSEVVAQTAQVFYHEAPYTQHLEVKVFM